MTVEPREGPPTIPDVLPVLPLRGTVIFPLAVVPLAVNQPSSVRLIDDIMRGDRLVALVARKSDSPEEAEPDDCYRVGTAGVVHQLARGPDGVLRLVVQGLERVRLLEVTTTDPLYSALVE